MYEYSKLQEKYLWLKARKYVAKIKKKIDKNNYVYHFEKE